MSTLDQRVEKLFEKVWEARSKVLACVAVFVVSDDEYNRKLLKKAWAAYTAAQNKYFDAARPL